MKKELRCPRCNSSQTRYRLKKGEQVCGTCGYQWKIKEEKKDNGNS